MKGKKVLVVDDGAINRKILRRILQDTYTVIEAENGLVAWELLSQKNNGISAVLLDLKMPVMDGFELLDKMKKGGMLELPVLVTTSENSPEVEQQILEAGAWDFISKPFNVDVVMARLRNAIARMQVVVYEKMQKLAAHDPLTNLYNRGRVFARTELLLQKYPEEQFAFLRVDIDHFAIFNSSFGEKEGDKLLCYMARLLDEIADRHEFRHQVYGRINADVFGACVTYSGEKQLQDIFGAMQKNLDSYRDDYEIKLSVGVCVIDDHNLEAEEIYTRAANGAARCKDQYDKFIGFYDAESKRKAQEAIGITNDMQKALDEKQFVIYLQAKYRLLADEACGAEALVRWQHPTKGLIMPGDFIPVFERNGFIAKLDYYVWEHTCQLIRSWLNAGYTVAPISVNISRVSLYNPKLADVMLDLVKKYNIDPALLELEVTESAYMTNPELMRQTISELHNYGFIILMDDFGSSYSSLNTLKEIEVDTLKVDMKFLPVDRNMGKSEIILASVIKMANWLGMAVIVEGVETRLQRNFLEGVGCDFVQGYLYARPIPSEEYAKKYIYTNKNLPKPKALDALENVSKPQHKVMILIIDDSEADRAVLKACFEEQYYVETCANAEEGLSFLRQNWSRVRLILVDNIMPGMSGMDFLIYCKSDPELSTIPTIMLTAEDNVKYQVQAFQNGAYDYVAKPLVSEVIRARVQHVLNVSYQMQNLNVPWKAKTAYGERDRVTGLLNKSAFWSAGKRTVEGAPNDKLALLIFDFDDFKEINEQFGHVMGDKVIAMIAEALNKGFRRTDLVGRIGGDEFAVLMSNLPPESVVRNKANQIIREAIIVYSKELHIAASVSAGVAFLEKMDTFEDAFERASQALYEAKSNGKSRTVIYGEQVPRIENDDKPVVVVCSATPQLFSAVAFSYGTTAAFAKVTNLVELHKCFDKYRRRIRAIVLDMEEDNRLQDEEEFYTSLVQYGGGVTVPVLAAYREGNMEALREAMALNVQDILPLPLQMSIVVRRLSRAIKAELNGPGTQGE